MEDSGVPSLFFRISGYLESQSASKSLCCLLVASAPVGFAAQSMLSRTVSEHNCAIFRPSSPWQWRVTMRYSDLRIHLVGARSWSEKMAVGI